jgi:hypothetical protein
MAFHDIAVLGAVVVAVALVLAAGRYLERYDRNERQDIEPEPPVRTGR